MRWQNFLLVAAGISDGRDEKQEQRERIQKMPDEVRSHPVSENDPVGADLLIERAECKGYQER